MLELAQFMQRFYTENGRYDQNTQGVSVTDASLWPTIQAEGYDLALSVIATNNYTLQAQPTAGGPQVGDACGTMTYTNAGVGLPANCW